jgi:hypothetical protein
MATWQMLQDGVSANMARPGGDEAVLPLQKELSSYLLYPTAFPAGAIEVLFWQLFSFPTLP